MNLAQSSERLSCPAFRMSQVADARTTDDSAAQHHEEFCHRSEGNDTSACSENLGLPDSALSGLSKPCLDAAVAARIPDIRRKCETNGPPNFNNGGHSRHLLLQQTRVHMFLLSTRLITGNCSYKSALVVEPATLLSHRKNFTERPFACCSLEISSQ